MAAYGSLRPSWVRSLGFALGLGQVARWQGAALYPEAKFNDEHIVALVIASRCHVVCSNDDTAIAYLKRADVFAGYNGIKRPKIFRGRKNHAKMCSKENVAACCQA